jgi:predicted MFS family arabinose efflux permease
MLLSGTSMGMVLGIPLTHWIAGQFSYEASFLFCALVNLLAGIGLFFCLPDSAHQRMGYGKQLAILRSGALVAEYSCLCADLRCDVFRLCLCHRIH